MVQSPIVHTGLKYRFSKNLNKIVKKVLTLVYTTTTPTTHINLNEKHTHIQCSCVAILKLKINHLWSLYKTYIIIKVLAYFLKASLEPKLALGYKLNY